MVDCDIATEHLTSTAIMDKCIKEREIRKTFVISVSFLCVFSAFLSIQDLQSSLNQEDGLGTTSLSIIYGALFFSCMFAPVAIKTMGCKKVITGTWLCHLIYIGTNFYPRWWTLIPSSILVGSTTGFLWTAQGVYLTQFSFSLSERTGIDRGVALARLNGIFFSIFYVTSFSGNIIASTVMFQSSQNETLVNFSDACGVNSCPGNGEDISFGRTNTRLVFIILGVFLVCEAIGVLLTIFALPEMDASLHMKSKPLAASMVACLQGLWDTRQLLLLPAVVFYSLADGVIWADYTKVKQLYY